MSKTISDLFKNPWLIRFLISIIIAASCTYLLTQFFLPYDFIVRESIIDSDKFKSYHDFENDGFSETLEFRNRGPNDHYIYIRNWNGGLIDQTNYLEPVNPFSMLYKDVTGDRLDEIFTITQAEDSLFLYIHNIASKKALINRLHLISPENQSVRKLRPLTSFPGCIADPLVYDHKVFIFAVRNNSVPSFLPRSVYAFDLNDQKIIRQFETHSALTDLFVYDLTGDGIDEIIVSGAAYGNIHYPAKYRDDQCWLFVLDQELKPIFKPLSFLEYSAELTCIPLEIRSERYLLVMADYTGDKNITSMMYLINAQGKIHLRRQNPFLNCTLFKPVVDHHINPSEIYGWKDTHSLIKLNHQLDVVREVSTPFKNLRPLFMIDMDADGQQELFCISGNLFLAFNTEFDLLARLELPVSGAKYSFKYTGPDNPVELGLRSGRKFYHLNFSPNRLYSFLPLLFTGLFVFFILLFSGTNRFLWIVNMYIKFFNYFFNNSSDGILIIDYQGKIRHLNTNFKHLLDLVHQPAKGDSILIIFRAYPQLLELIKESLDTRQAIQQTVVLGNQETRPELQITVEPFPSMLKSSLNFLVQVAKITPGKMSHNIQTWSRAVQKMAHDIKTPLSTIVLNLKILQMRLEKISMTEDEHHGLSDDINMMQTELENIQTMTKNFLKFSNLDHPHFQAFNIREIIDKAIDKYQPYLIDDLKIQASIDDDVKPVWADPQQIEMVFHILLENALAAMQGKGLINIAGSMAQYLDVSFSEYLEVEVADTGPGINPDDKKKIFEPYFTTKEMGTGMGLAIAKKIIEDHNCTIDVHSKPNLGAVFLFSLPVIKEDENNE